MKLRSLTRSFSRLSAPKKLAVAIAAIAGGGVLVSIPILSLRPPSLPTVVDEDAYYRSRVTESSPAEETTAGEAETNLNTTSPPNLFSFPDQSAPISGLNSPATDANKPNTTNTLGGLKDSQTSNTAGNLSESTNNPYSQPQIADYTPKSSLTSPYSQPQPNSSLSTPYSLSSPNIGSTSNPYSTQPNLGSYTNPSTPSSLGSYTNPSTPSNLGNSTINPSTPPSLGTTNPSTPPSLGTTNPSTSPSLGSYNSPSITNNSSMTTAPGIAPTISNEGAIAPSTLNGSSGNSIPTPTTNPGGYTTTPDANTTSSGTYNFNNPSSTTSPSR